MDETVSGIAFADTIVIAGFFVVMLGIGFYFSGRMRDLQDYFSGGRRVPWWLSGTSFYMSSFSAFAFVVAYSELAYKYGWVSITIFWVTIPGSIISAYFFAARWRRAATTSPLEYIEQRFGAPMRQLLAWLGIPVKVIDDGLKLFAIGSLVSTGLNFPLGYAVFFSGTIMLTYTFLGGLWAVLITDFVQFVVMTVAVIVLIPLAYQAVGGWSNFSSGVPEGFFAWTAPEHGWLSIFFVFILIGLNYSTSWSLVQRYYSVRRDTDARKVGYFVAFLNIIGPPLLFAPAMAARVFMPEIEDTSQVYGILCKALLPVGMVGMVIAAMFSATMSMLSSDYNAVASVLTNDVYKRFVAPQASQKSLVLVARIATLIVGIISLAVAFLVIASQGESDLCTLMVRLFSIFLPPVAIPMLVGLTMRRVSNMGGIVGLILGMAAGLTAYGLGSIESLEVLRHKEVMTCITVFANDCRFGFRHTIASGEPRTARTHLSIYGSNGMSGI